MVGNTNRKTYTMIVFEEDERYGKDGMRLDFYSDNPVEGLLSDVVFGNDLDELMVSSDGQSNEGLFYLLYDNRTGKRIGSGTVDFTVIEEEVNIAEGRRYAVGLEDNFDNDPIEWFYSKYQALEFAKRKAKEGRCMVHVNEVLNGIFVGNTIQIECKNETIIVKGLFSGNKSEIVSH